MKKAIKKAKTTNTSKIRLIIDHPENNETITCEHYAARISSTKCEKVEATIDGHKWGSCRNEAGYWWFDINNLSRGVHCISARVHSKNVIISVSKEFKVL
jgi:hypothetical protein